MVTTQPVGEQASLPRCPTLAASHESLRRQAGRSAAIAPTGEGYAIFQVTGIVAAHAPAFADWKSHMLNDYRDEQLPALLSQKTEELAAKAKEMNDLAKAAKEWAQR